MRKNLAERRIGEVNRAKNGMLMKIIEYGNVRNIDVQFEDGTVVTNKTYSDFKKGSIANPLSFKLRVGEENIANNGMKMKIIEYRSLTDIDVQFEDGTIVHNKNYGNFKRGLISNPLFYKSRIGEIVTSNNGMRVILIEYRSCNDIDVQLEDGTIFNHKRYTDFKCGQIGFPLGRKGGRVLYNFHDLKKAYKWNSKTYYFCKDERGSSYILTPQQMLEKSGIKLLF